MPEVWIPTQLQHLTRGAQRVPVNGATVAGVIADLARHYPEIEIHLIANGELLPGLAVIVDGDHTSLGVLQPVDESSEVHFLPAVGGGGKEAPKTMDAKTVNTMRGPVPTDALGFTLMHEHVFVHSAGVVENWPHIWDRASQIKAAIKTLNQAKKVGVDTILDLTTIDLGRDITRLREVADQVDMNIIVATGVWIDPPLFIRSMSPEQLADLFIHDVEEGIGQTGVKAGAIKVASEPIVDQGNTVILKAASIAHRKTGVPISTHTYVRYANGLAQQDAFEREGVDLERVIIGHTGDSEDLEYVEAILKRGSYIGMDRFGLGLSTSNRTKVVAQMCDRGHAERMVLSHDTSCHMGLRPANPDNPWETNYLRIHNEVLPLLHDYGVTDSQVTAMTTDNPRRIFELQGGY